MYPYLSKVKIQSDLDHLVFTVRFLPAEPVLYAERVLLLVDSLLVAGAVCLVRVARPVDSADAVARVATKPVIWKVRLGVATEPVILGCESRTSQLRKS